jgi:hypothetical protein
MDSRNPLPFAAKALWQRPCVVEGLESRQLLSASGVVVHPDMTVLPAAASGSVSGYTPTQIRHAYGFDKVKFNGVVGSGAGQTIAIVDAFRDANIVKDMGVFDAKFGLAAPPSFTIVNQRGGSAASVRTDSSWAGEIALDVEWAHAIAPKAKLDLIETDSDDLNNLLAGVKIARQMAGVSVVSMSWGGPEFFGQQNKDSIFTTPAGHTPVSFVAASGDEGSYGGAEWPASSPNVLSVGGTSLFTLDNAGSYANEAPWSDSSGGVSRMEATPAFQKVVQASRRSVPDVAYDADPYSGFAVYDSVSDGGAVGWQEVGGTSAGTPQWAALIAIADQGRALLHKAALDGVANALPALYHVYNTSVYAADFHDIVSGWHAFNSRAHAGYDVATGLGTPHADKIIPLLVAVGKASTTPGNSTGGTTTTGVTSGSVGSTGSTGTTTAPKEAHGSNGSSTPGAPVTDDDGPDQVIGSILHVSPPPAPGNPPPIVQNAPARQPASVAASSDFSDSSTGTKSSGVSKSVATVAISAALDAMYIAKTGAAMTDAGARLMSLAGFTIHGVSTSSPLAISSGPASFIGRELMNYLPAAQTIANVFSAIGIGSGGVPSGVTPVGAAQVSSAPMAATAAVTAARGLFHIAPIDATALFSDALANFASQCAAVSGPLDAASAPTRRAWAITAGVLVIDAALLGHWYARRRQTTKALQSRDQIFRDGAPLAE